MIFNILTKIILFHLLNHLKYSFGQDLEEDIFCLFGVDEGLCAVPTPFEDFPETTLTTIRATTTTTTVKRTSSPTTATKITLPKITTVPPKIITTTIPTLTTKITSPTPSMTIATRIASMVGTVANKILSSTSPPISDVFLFPRSSTKLATIKTTMTTTTPTTTLSTTSKTTSGGSVVFKTLKINPKFSPKLVNKNLFDTGGRKFVPFDLPFEESFIQTTTPFSDLFGFAFNGFQDKQPDNIIVPNNEIQSITTVRSFDLPLTTTSSTKVMVGKTSQILTTITTVNSNTSPFFTKTSLPPKIIVTNMMGTTIPSKKVLKLDLTFPIVQDAFVTDELANNVDPLLELSEKNNFPATTVGSEDINNIDPTESFDLGPLEFNLDDNGEEIQLNALHDMRRVRKPGFTITSGNFDDGNDILQIPSIKRRIVVRTFTRVIKFPASQSEISALEDEFGDHLKLNDQPQKFKLLKKVVQIDSTTPTTTQKFVPAKHPLRLKKT